jgi:uncharacterized protein
MIKGMPQSLLKFYPKYFSRILSLILLGFLWAELPAQKWPEKPREWVTDYAGILSNREEQSLNNILRAYEDTTSNQIVVAIFQNAQGYPVEDYSIRLAEKWEVGQKGRDNGIILAVFLDEHKIRIEVGYGLEDKVPDATAIQIAQNVIPPYFRKGKYYEGLNRGIISLMSAASGKFKSSPRRRSKDGGSPIPFLFLFILIIFLLSLFRRKRTTVGSRGWRSSGPFFFCGTGGGGSWGGFSGSGGGGGFSSGGGSFGGGGATGSW